MTSRQDGGGRGRESFLSAHRCPEVDLLPHHNAETQISLPRSLVPAVINSELSCTGQSEADYLEVSSCRHSEDEEKEEEEEGSISDWSEEDLSLHFSPSVILPSDDEEFYSESGFECVDITVETQVKGQHGEGLKIKMVPKRQIQLKKRDAENIDADKRQMILKDGPAEEGGANSEVSANELVCPTVQHRPDVLLRQHSMPASFHPHLMNSSNVDSYSVYKGRVAAASQGFHVGGNSAPRQRLQKSFSLDETKTKMASCIIKSVLSKKMQVEQNTSNSENHNNSTNCNTKTSHVQNVIQQNHKAPVLLGLQPAEQERETDGGGGGKAVGVFKAPVHVVRDMRSLVKNTYSLSFRNNSSAPTTQPETKDKPATFKVIGQEDSPPPSYQQAVGHHQTKNASVYSSTSRGFVAKVAASLNQSQDRKESDRFNRPITQHRRGSEPIISRNKVDDDTWPAMLLDPPTKPPASSRLSEPGQSERATGVSHSQPPLPSSTPNLAQGTQLPLSAQGQSSILGVSSQSQPILHSCFHALPAFPAALHPHLGRVSYVQSPLSFSQLQLQSVPPQGPTLHLLQRSQSEDNSRPTGNMSYQPEGYKGLIKCCPPPSSTAGNQESNCNSVTVSATQEQQQQQHLHQGQQQQQQQQQFLCNVQGFLPAQVGSDFPVDITGSAAAPGALFSGPAPPYHMMLDPKSGQCFYVDTPPQPQRKMLLDPETGQYIEVFLPAASSAPNASVIAVCGANPAPTVLSVMQFQPPLAMSSLYAPPCLPFTLHTPSVNYTHTAP